jgi:hypothetical protein
LLGFLTGLLRGCICCCPWTLFFSCSSARFSFRVSLDVSFGFVGLMEIGRMAMMNGAMGDGNP